HECGSLPWFRLLNRDGTCSARMPDDHHHHHAHSHGLTNLRIAFFLNVGFAVIEVVGGLLTNSVAILSDALHDFGDSLSIGLSWWLERFSAKEQDQVFSYGYQRFSLVGGLINAVVLLVGSVVILLEAVPRLLHPEPTYAPGMTALAVLGLAVNGAAVLRLRNEATENARVVTLHLLEDVFGWAAVLVGSAIIWLTDWYAVDPLLSIGITLWILRNVYMRLKQTISLFLQSVPSGIDLKSVKESLLSIPDVKALHHTHAWSLDGAHHVLTTHLEITSRDFAAVSRVKSDVRRIASELGFYHVTAEIEFEGEECSMSSSTCPPSTS
ncbi:MAG: cation transporter, partial [Bdellovibrionales bacterium]|nr:cation transporter [Bdellovibrionales bacterium]